MCSVCTQVFVLVCMHAHVYIVCVHGYVSAYTYVVWIHATTLYITTVKHHLVLVIKLFNKVTGEGPELSCPLTGAHKPTIITFLKHYNFVTNFQSQLITVTRLIREQ